MEKVIKKATAPVIFCRLSVSSLPDISRIEKVCEPNPWSQALLKREFFKPLSLYYGARQQGVLAGYLLAHVVADEAHVLKVGVLPQFRRRGIASGLLQYVTVDFYDRGVRWVTLEVRESNKPARSLYDSLGFYEVGRRKGYYVDNGEDALVMSLNVREFLDRCR
ncbi:MAG: ribosomal-protein-alanine N-acetyltransferase, partial [Candidatus Dadabacteria bacterium]